MLKTDLLRIASNCKIYTPDTSSEYHKDAVAFESLVLEMFTDESASSGGTDVGGGTS